MRTGSRDQQLQQVLKAYTNPKTLKAVAEYYMYDFMLFAYSTDISLVLSPQHPPLSKETLQKRHCIPNEA